MRVRKGFKSIADAEQRAAAVRLPSRALDRNQTAVEWIRHAAIQHGCSEKNMSAEDIAFVKSLQSRVKAIDDVLRSPLREMTGITITIWTMWIFSYMEDEVTAEILKSRMIDTVKCLNEDYSIEIVMFPGNLTEHMQPWSRHATESKIEKQMNNLLLNAYKRTGIPIHCWQGWISENVVQTTDVHLLESKVSEVENYARSFTVDGEIVLELVNAAFPEFSSANPRVSARAFVNWRWEICGHSEDGTCRVTYRG